MSNKIPCGGFYLSDTLGVDEISEIRLTSDNTISEEFSMYPITDNNGVLLTPLILPSSSGSSKKFKITVDDTGTISATEYTT